MNRTTANRPPRSPRAETTLRCLRTAAPAGAPSPPPRSPSNPGGPASSRVGTGSKISSIGFAPAGRPGSAVAARFEGDELAVPALHRRRIDGPRFDRGVGRRQPDGPRRRGARTYEGRRRLPAGLHVVRVYGRAAAAASFPARPSTRPSHRRQGAGRRRGGYRRPAGPSSRGDSSAPSHRRTSAAPPFLLTAGLILSCLMPGWASSGAVCDIITQRRSQPCPPRKCWPSSGRSSSSWSPRSSSRQRMMGCYQRKIDQNPQTESSKDWQFRLGKICASTMRYELAADMFGKFIERYEKDPRRPEAMWRRAEAFRDADHSLEAREAYRVLAIQYPEDPVRPEGRPVPRVVLQGLPATIIVGIFKAYDVRGRYPTEIDEGFALRLGAATSDSSSPPHRRGARRAQERPRHRRRRDPRSARRRGRRRRPWTVHHPMLYFAVAAWGSTAGSW